MVQCQLHIICALAVLLSVVNQVCPAKRTLPSFVKKCQRYADEATQQKCFNENLEIFRPKLAKGIPEMRIPALDPLFLEKVNMDAHNFHAEFYNTSVYGASNFEVTKTMFDVETNYLGMEMRFPDVRIENDYKIQGRLVIEINSSGHHWNNITDLGAKLEMRGSERKAKGRTYMDFNDKSKNKIKLNFGSKPVLYFENIFTGNEELTRHTNQIINDNMDDVLRELLPVVEEVIGSFVFNTIQQIFNMYPLEELFIYP